MGKSENPPAFPFVYEREIAPGVAVEKWETGMSLRDWFAGQVLPVVAADLAQDRNEAGPNDLPRLSAIGAYLYADAMLAEREKSK